MKIEALEQLRALPEWSVIRREKHAELMILINGQWVECAGTGHEYRYSTEGMDYCLPVELLDPDVVEAEGGVETSAAMITALISEVGRLRAAIERAEEIHPLSAPICPGCEYKHPCPSREALGVS